jgi:hypothetical protein
MALPYIAMLFFDINHSTVFATSNKLDLDSVNNKNKTQPKPLSHAAVKMDEDVCYGMIIINKVNYKEGKGSFEGLPFIIKVNGENEENEEKEEHTKYVHNTKRVLVLAVRLQDVSRIRFLDMTTHTYHHGENENAVCVTIFLTQNLRSLSVLNYPMHLPGTCGDLGMTTCRGRVTSSMCRSGCTWMCRR